MKDLEKMTREELERAYRDARNIGDASRRDLLEDELDRRDWVATEKEWAQERAEEEA